MDSLTTERATGPGEPAFYELRKEIKPADSWNERIPFLVWF
jgi:hypothetical protein